MEKHKPLVSIISINYNNVVITGEMINSLASINYPNIEVIIVDNNSSESPMSLLELRFPLKLIKSDKNLGFAGGNNLGIKHASGEYYLLLNNDVEVHPDFLGPMVELMEREKNIGAVSPKIKYFESPNIIQYAGHNGINHFTGRGFSRGFKEEDEGQYNDTCEAQLLHGAAMMIRRSVVEDIGAMRESYFLYYEEVDYCERIRNAGYKMFYTGDSEIYHKESMSVGKDSPLKVYYLNRNRVLFLRLNTTGFKRICSILLFSLFAFPKKALAYTIKGDFTRLSALIKGITWHFTRININPIASLK